MPLHRYVAAALALLPCVWAVPAHAAAIDLSDAAAVARLEGDLADTNFTVREKAQQVLTTVPLKDREILVRLAATSADAEVKARLLARVAELDELAVTDPPGITLGLRYATLTETAAALAKATGTPIEAPGNPRPPSDYVLTVENKPFWEIYRLLNAQHAFTIGSTAAGAQLLPRDPDWDHLAIHRGFAVFLKDPVVQGMGVVGVADGKFGQPFSIRMDLGIDPRIQVCQAGMPVLSRAVDDLGQGWTLATAITNSTLPTKAILIARSLSLAAPAEPGKTLTLSGKWPITIAEEMAEATIADFDKPPPNPLKLGDLELTITRLTRTLAPAGGGNTSLALSLSRKSLSGDGPAALAALPAGGAAVPVGTSLNAGPPLTMTLLDADGKVIVSRTLPNAQSLGTTMSVRGNVARIVFTYPKKMRDYAVPFEFHAPVKH